MRHRKAKVTLDRNSAQRRRLFRNLVRSLVLHERIVTTTARGKVTRAFVERLVTMGKHGDLHHRRQMLRRLPDESAVKKIFDVLSPRYKESQGGYTRTTKLAVRAGDGAARVVVEFVTK